MMIGKVKIGSLKREPKYPKFQNPFAHKNCDCVECSAIIKHDAWFIHNDNDGLTGKKLIYRASQQNGWIEDGPYVA